MIPARAVTPYTTYTPTVPGNSLAVFGNYLPQFITGLVLLLVGIVVAIILKELILRSFSFLKIEDLFGNIGKWLDRIRSGRVAEEKAWLRLLAELVRWTVIILFLIPVTQIWGLPKASDLLNQLLVYIPNVFVAIVIALVGIVVANLVSEIIKNASKSIGSVSSNLLGTVAKYSLIFFTILVVLNQLGVAADLIRILFMGIVAMVAVAGGLAFGLGGKETAGKFLDDLKNKIAQ